MAVRRYGRYSFTTSNENKVLWPDEGITKGQLIDYYDAVADVMLSHIKGHPLSLKRFPDGIEAFGFYQKDASKHFPDWITTAKLPKKGGTVNHVVADKKATIVYLANQACIEFHQGLAQVDKPDRPDQLVVDLDPVDDDFDLARETALLVRDLYDDLGLPAFAKTTGGKGIHVVTPLDRSATFDEVREFARSVAEVLAAEHPDRLTTEVRKAKRNERLFLDVGRNAYAQTAVCPYSARARPGAPVSMPIDWSEVENKRLHPSRFTMAGVPKRLAAEGDVWSGMKRRARSLTAAATRLKRLASS